MKQQIFIVPQKNKKKKREGGNKLHIHVVYFSCLSVVALVGHANCQVPAEKAASRQRVLPQERKSMTANGQTATRLSRNAGPHTAALLHVETNEVKQSLTHLSSARQLLGRKQNKV